MSNPFHRPAKPRTVRTFVNLRGILLVGDFSSADMWQYPPPCMKIPIRGTSTAASRSMSGDWVGELEDDAPDVLEPRFGKRVSCDERLFERARS